MAVARRRVESLEVMRVMCTAPVGVRWGRDGGDGRGVVEEVGSEDGTDGGVEDGGEDGLSRVEGSRDVEYIRGWWDGVVGRRW